LTTAIEVAHKRGNVLTDKGDLHAAAVAFAHMRSAARAAGDRRREALALAHQGRALLGTHDLAAARRTSGPLWAVAADRFEEVRLFASSELGSFCHLQSPRRSGPFLRGRGSSGPPRGRSLQPGLVEHQ